MWDSSACRDFSPPVLDHVSSETGRSYTCPVTVHFAGTSLPSSSSALSLGLLEMVSGQSAYTDSLPPSLVLLLHWWLDYETLSRSTASSTALFLTSHTDASKECGGAHLEPLSLIMYGMWSPQEYHLHINNLELRAVLSRLYLISNHIFRTPV